MIGVGGELNKERSVVFRSNEYFIVRVIYIIDLLFILFKGMRFFVRGRGIRKVRGCKSEI